MVLDGRLVLMGGPSLKSDEIDFTEKLKWLARVGCTVALNLVYQQQTTSGTTSASPSSQLPHQQKSLCGEAMRRCRSPTSRTRK